MNEPMLGNGPKVNPLRYPSLKCDNCGHELFEEKVVIKEIPGVIVGTGNESAHVPLPVYVCAKCGTIEKRARETIEKGLGNQEENKEKENTSGLIL